MDDQLRQRIEEILGSHKIVLFMKGTKSFPQCGFSATVVEVLKRVNADFHTVNILQDADLRQGMKDYASWPTFPQLYVDGRFVGGCDIVRDMYEGGELQPIVDKALGRA
ncbi:Grx4 family monothiol glutaredoxin [Sandaracinus amylolyticus]|uniref:Glutaredoxin n=1 Tax=Sandaracinus amylolyticus TaxID=927083 RepID=A0A0F6W2I5_9BACT|nr:Grx4 family monothiol glutaredoxin [Sandaracinus amylolyticus]AKF05843.1 putative monothiol glutaredoxin ycf64-like protein [Sandaracinus amylolyticus]